MKRTTCKIFSDASFDNLTGKCGYGVAIVMHDLCILKYGSIRGAKSSCEAEMLAAKKGVDYLNTKEFQKLGRPVTKVVLFSDNHCVRAVDQKESSTLKKWERSPNGRKQRLVKIAKLAEIKISGPKVPLYGPECRFSGWFQPKTACFRARMGCGIGFVQQVGSTFRQCIP